MKLGLQHIWLGDVESLNNLIKLNAYLESPTKDAKAFYGQDDDEEEEKSYKGIGGHLIQVEEGTGVIRVSGSLTHRYSFWNKYFGVVSYDEIRDSLVSLANDNEITNILVEMDTGGGSASGVNEVSDLISSIDAKIKPVTGHTSMYAFSAGMWILSACRTISASPMSEVGSVGVIITMASYHEMYKKAGVDIKVIRAGKYKALGNPAEPMSEEAIKEAEQKADQLYGYFIDQMTSGRPQLSSANKEVWAEGKTFFADEGILVGLIDKVESFDNTVANLCANYDNSRNDAQFSAETDLKTELEDGTEMATNKKVLNEKSLAAASLGANVGAKEAELSADEIAAAALVEEQAAATLAEEEAAAAKLAGGGEEEEVGSKDLMSLVTKVSELSAENATLKLNLEASELKVTESTAGLTALTSIAGTSINRLEIALGKSTSTVADLSASAVADRYAKLNVDFEAAFSIGKPSSARMEESREQAPNVTAEFCTIHKPS